MSRARHSHRFYQNKFFLLASSAIAIGIALYLFMQEDEAYLDQDIRNLSLSEPPNDFIPRFSIGAAADDFTKLHKAAGADAVSAAQATMMQLKDVISKELPCYFSYQVFSWLMQREMPLGIAMVPPIVMDMDETNLNGAFMPGELKQFDNNLPNIQIVAHSNLLNQKSPNVKFTLRNEFFHSICDQVNRLRTQDVEKRFYPFLDTQGNVVSALFERFTDCIHKAASRFDRLQNLLNRKFLFAHEQLELSNAQHILRHYKPFVYLITLSNKAYNDVIKNSRIHIQEGKKNTFKKDQELSFKRKWYY